jgi:hypothetical protein
MRWRPKPVEEWPRDHWEQIVRTMIERIGLEQLCEIVESVATKMREGDESSRLIVLARHSAARPSQP